MPWFTCATCKHKDHAAGTPTLPCTNPQPCRGTMTADPPRPPADFGPGHVAERAAERDRTLTSSPPPVAPPHPSDDARELAAKVEAGLAPVPAPMDHDALVEAGLVCPCGNSDPANCPSRDQHRADYERAMETVVFFAPLAAGRPGKYKLLLLRERTEGEPPPTPIPACASCNALHTGFTARVHGLSSELAAATARAAELERQLDALEADGFHARKPDRSWVACPECGPNVASDEDGCCASCGRDCAQIHAWDSGDAAAGGVSDVRAKLPDRLGRRAAIAGLIGYLVEVRRAPNLTSDTLRARQAARDVFLRALEAAIAIVVPSAATARSEARTLFRDGWNHLDAVARRLNGEADRDPKPANMPDATQAHQVGSEAEGIRAAAGGALDAIGCRLGVFRPDGETDADYRPRLLRAVTQPVLQPVAAAPPPTSRALEVIADMREVAELCSSGAGYGDEVRPMAVLGTLAALERRLTEAG